MLRKKADVLDTSKTIFDFVVPGSGAKARFIAFVLVFHVVVPFMLAVGPLYD